MDKTLLIVVIIAVIILLLVIAFVFFTSRNTSVGKGSSPTSQIVNTLRNLVGSKRVTMPSAERPSNFTYRYGIAQ